MTFADIEARVVAHLTAALEVPVSVELQSGFDQRLPVVQVQALPGSFRDRPFNGGPVTAEIDVDVDVYAADMEQVYDVGQQVMSVLEGWRDHDLSVQAKSLFAKRPDFNPSIRRRGAVFTALLRRT